MLLVRKNQRALYTTISTAQKKLKVEILNNFTFLLLYSLHSKFVWGWDLWFWEQSYTRKRKSELFSSLLQFMKYWSFHIVEADNKHCQHYFETYDL